MVPVLSSTMALTLWPSSRLSASLIRMLFSAPFPTPTMMAVGVARPRAHGQAITNTVTIASSPWVRALSPPSTTQARKLTIAMPMTTGTKIPATLSTSFCTGALLPCACCTILMIWARIVSPPTFSASKRKLPFWLTVPANTFSPALFSTGTGSPLIMLSST